MSDTPRCNALSSNPLDSFDYRAWATLARELELELQSYGPSMPWVPVSEKRPKWDPKADDVLAYTITGHVVAVHPNRIDALWNTRHDGEECFYTHWAPLPSGPSTHATGSETSKEKA